MVPASGRRTNASGLGMYPYLPRGSSPTSESVE